MGTNKFSPNTSEAATSETGHEPTPAGISIDDLRTMLFDAEARIADFHKAAAPERIRLFAHFAGLALSYLHEIDRNAEDSKTTVEYLARSLDEIIPEVRGVLNLTKDLPPLLDDEAAMPDLWVGLEAMSDNELELLERSIGEILAKRKPAPEPTKSEGIKDAVNRVRMAFALNSFFTFKPPASLDEPWARNCLTSIKRDIHHLSPAELISLSMFLGNAVATPLPYAYKSYIEERAEQSRKWYAEEKAKHEQRATKRGGRS
jgi:hypothetical protein